MSSKKSTKQTFVVNACLKMWVGCEIKAASLEDAIVQSKSLTTDDFVKTTDCTDYSMKIIQVYDPNFSIDID